MENYPSSSNNNNHLQNFDPMPIRACLPSSDQSSSSATQNIESSFSSVTPLRNNRMYDPKMNRLTAMKRLARNRPGKTYPKYGPYPCQWCPKKLPTSQSFAGHMRAHYRKIETAARKAAKQAQQQKQQQQQQQQHLTPEQQQAKALANAQAHAMAELVKARAQAEKLARLLAQINAKAEAKAVPKPRARAPAPAEAPAPATAPAPVASGGSGKKPLRTNDCHLRLSNCQFGLIISPGNKNNSVSTESVSNAIDFLYSRRRPIIPSSSSADVLHHHHNLQVQPGLASSSRSRPSIDVNKKQVFVKQEVFPDEDVKPPPGFHHLLSSEGPHGRMFIMKKERVEFDDDEVVACESLDNLALKL